jgi:hypothetical protein
MLKILLKKYSVMLRQLARYSYSFKGNESWYKITSGKWRQKSGVCGWCISQPQRTEGNSSDVDEEGLIGPIYKRPERTHVRLLAMGDTVSDCYVTSRLDSLQRFTLLYTQMNTKFEDKLAKKKKKKKIDLFFLNNN